jgi:hypothetical protein
MIDAMRALLAVVISAVVGTVTACGGDTCTAPPTPGSMTFTYTGSRQQFTVPECVTSIVVDAYGAEGGTGQTPGGLGGHAHARIPVEPGAVLLVDVGGAGFTADVSPTGGYNGGGGVRAGAITPEPGASGTGGGASDIRRGTSLASRLIVAGGGGGGGAHGAGGDGGGLEGEAGATSDPVNRAAGGGGTQTAGGAAGWADSNYPTGPGLFGTGGTCYHDMAGCGGGGGGWYGGGTGGFAGGGGSSWVDAEGNSETSTTPGVNSGNGRVEITWGD